MEPVCLNVTCCCAALWHSKNDRKLGIADLGRSVVVMRDPAHESPRYSLTLLTSLTNTPPCCATNLRVGSNSALDFLESVMVYLDLGYLSPGSYAERQQAHMREAIV